MDESGPKKSELRKKAEKILHQRGVKDARLYALDLEQLVEELNVYQIELEHQNNEIQKTQERLEESLNMYLDLFENAPNPYFTIDSDYQIRNVNKAALNLLNVEKSVLLNTNFYKFIHPESQDDFLFLLRKAKTSGPECKPETTEIKLYSANKKLLYVRVDGKQCFSEEDKPFLFNISLTNLTNLRKAHEVLQIRDIALESAANSIIITDPEGTIEWVNKAFSQLTGYSKEEVIGKNPRDLVKSGKHPKSFFAALWKRISEGKVWHGKVINKRKDGSTYTEEQTISPVFNKNGNIIRYISVKSDITDKMILEKELTDAKEKAEESSRLKSAFLANISHEVRTPMNGILGFAELLNRTNLSTDKHDKYVDVIMKSGQRMLRILNDLIDISKIEAGETALNIEAFDLEESMAGFYEFFLPEARKQGLELNYSTDIPSNQSIVQTDKTKVSQIFSNLISNALKYTDEGSVNFSCKVINEELFFEVSDTGVGISDAIIDKIFDRFGRYEKHHVKFREGVGLGLAICKAYADILGGSLDVESKIGEGSHFTYSMPLCEETVNGGKQEKQNPSDPIKFKSQVVLIAEDDDHNYMYLEELLSETNLKLLRAENGKQAVELVKNNPDIKLILMDVRMPEMDGLDACRRIKENSPDIPVIIQTAYAFAEDKEKAFESGCDDFISKPLEQDTLFTKMNLLIR
jgi:PAS domain S-box-containing protein